MTALRHWVPGRTWRDVRQLLADRHVAVNGFLCLDAGRRVSTGEIVSLFRHPLPPPPGVNDVVIRFLDSHLVVVEKPSGMVTLRPQLERRWPASRRSLQPTLDEVLVEVLVAHSRECSKNQAWFPKSRRGLRRGETVRRQGPPTPPLALWPVHRLDRDTSGLVVVALDSDTQQHLIRAFARHEAGRNYLALIPGALDDQTIRSTLVRDRGDGLRGSPASQRSDEPVPGGQLAITYVSTLRTFTQSDLIYSELLCRLETGRTNQIRIHLAELGHPICGDIKYRGPYGVNNFVDASGVPRLALHATELRFVHPMTGQEQVFTSAWPDELVRFIASPKR